MREQGRGGGARKADACATDESTLPATAVAVEGVVVGTIVAGGGGEEGAGG